MPCVTARAARAPLLLIALFAAGCAPGAKDAPKAGGTLSEAIVEPYLKIQVALARDSMDEVKANAGNIATAATTLGAPAFKIDTAALQLVAAGDIAEARARFGTLSDAMITFMTGLHLTPPEGVSVAFCPMTQQPWLQKGPTIANPYYGSQMPTCGSFR